MKLKIRNENFNAFSAQWEEGLQALFQSLSTEWDNILKDQKIEDMHEFMGKWVEGVRDLVRELHPEETILPGREASDDHLSSQDKKITSLEPTLISQVENHEILRMIKKLQQDVLMSEGQSAAPLWLLFLEVAGDKGAGSLNIPVNLENLYQGMVVLETQYPWSITDIEILKGQKAILHLRNLNSLQSMKLEGTLTLTNSRVDQKINLILKVKDTKSIKEVGKILLKSLPHASIAHQLLWNLWEGTQENRESTTEDQKTKFYLLLLACGTIWTSFVNPGLYPTMLSILSSLGLGQIIKVIRDR
jgi:hypothetical protein